MLDRLQLTLSLTPARPLERACFQALGPLLQMNQAEALRWACQAVAWLAQGMQLQGGFRQHPGRYNALEHRYEQRFAFLQRCGSPEAIPYHQLMADMVRCAPQALSCVAPGFRE